MKVYLKLLEATIVFVVGIDGVIVVVNVIVVNVDDPIISSCAQYMFI